MYGPGGPTLLELARQALSSTDRGYDLLAPKFDVTPFRTPDEVLRPAIDAVGEVDRALDVCCGTGAALHLLRARARRLIVGVDRSAGMLAECARRAATTTGAPVALVRGDALALPFVDAFDAIVSFGAFGHVLRDDEPRLIAAVHRALRRGGRFVFVTSTHPPLLSRRHVVARAFNAAMRARNAVLRPPFVMYYLTFLLPDVERQLRAAGFAVDVRDASYPAPYDAHRIVVATKV